MAWNPFRRKERQDEPMTEQVSAFWSETFGTAAFSPRLVDRVWVANRCIQLNAQQIASWKLVFTGTFEPAWMANPDPVWYPNGISDAVFAAVRSLYGWGDAFLLVTSRYASGMPAGWTVLDPAFVNVEMNERGRRRYRVGSEDLATDDVVQITRDPGTGLRGTSALRAYAAQSRSAIASADLAEAIYEGGIPNAVIKSTRKLTAEQAAALQAQWVEATTVRRGAPAILPPELDFEQLAFSPEDLTLLASQEFNARVIASAFGVPAFLLNIPMTGSLVYQNPVSLGEYWWRTELRPTAKRVADALTARLLPRGNSVVFDAGDLVKPIETATILDDSQVIEASPADGSGNVRPLRPAQGGIG